MRHPEKRDAAFRAWGNRWWEDYWRERLVDEVCDADDPKAHAKEMIRALEDLREVLDEPSNGH